MERHRGHHSLRGIGTFATLLVVALGASGCGNMFQRACQPASQPVRGLEEATWRLIYTNNPAQRYRAYDFIFSFEILAFGRQFDFNIKRVIRNRQFNNPIQVGNYNTNGKGLLVMQFQSPPSGGDGGEAASGGQALGTSQFDYTLGSKLTLRDRKTGYVYRYVQFTGVVSPSVACVFK